MSRVSVGVGVNAAESENAAESVFSTSIKSCLQSVLVIFQAVCSGRDVLREAGQQESLRVLGNPATQHKLTGHGQT